MANYNGSNNNNKKKKTKMKILRQNIWDNLSDGSSVE
jgi:hypothetical protein